MGNSEQLGPPVRTVTRVSQVPVQAADQGFWAELIPVSDTSSLQQPPKGAQQGMRALGQAALVQSHGAGAGREKGHEPRESPVSGSPLLWVPSHACCWAPSLSCPCL